MRPKRLLCVISSPRQAVTCEKWRVARAGGTERGIRFAGFAGVGYGSGMSELIFMVEEAPEGGFTARALGEAIFTEADSMEDLRKQVADAVQCHFEPGKAPRVVRLHIVKEEILAA